jgi:hypothetical protein
MSKTDNDFKFIQVQRKIRFVGASLDSEYSSTPDLKWNNYIALQTFGKKAYTVQAFVSENLKKKCLRNLLYLTWQSDDYDKQWNENDGICPFYAIDGIPERSMRIWSKWRQKPANDVDFKGMDDNQWAFSSVAGASPKDVICVQCSLNPYKNHTKNLYERSKIVIYGVYDNNISYDNNWVSLVLSAEENLDLGSLTVLKHKREPLTKDNFRHYLKYVFIPFGTNVIDPVQSFRKDDSFVEKKDFSNFEKTSALCRVLINNDDVFAFNTWALDYFWQTSDEALNAIRIMEYILKTTYTIQRLDLCAKIHEKIYLTDSIDRDDDDDSKYDLDKIFKNYTQSYKIFSDFAQKDKTTFLEYVKKYMKM